MLIIDEDLKGIVPLLYSLGLVLELAMIAK
jgi:hypothetical protein